MATATPKPAAGEIDPATVLSASDLNVVSPSVKIVFEIVGDSDAATPAPILAETRALTVGAIRQHALSTTAAHHPKGCLSVKLNGRFLSPNDDSGPLVVPLENLIRVSPPKPAREEEAATPEEDEEEAAGTPEQDKETGSPKQEEQEEQETKADDTLMGENDETAAKETGDDAASNKKDAAKVDGKESTEEAAEAAGAAAGDEKKATGEDKVASKPSAKPARRPPRQQRAPLPPPTAMKVTILVQPLNSRDLTDRRNVLLPEAAEGAASTGKCSACRDASLADVGLLLDCGHLVCEACLQAATAKADAAVAAKKQQKADGEADVGGASKKPAGAPLPRRVVCPVCRFSTTLAADFRSGASGDAAAAEGDADGSGQEQLAEFGRRAKPAVDASTRSTCCVVCTSAPAVGRCSVEMLNMCESCFETHLPQGPLRNTHTLLRFDNVHLGDAAAVLCEKAGHRNLPISYFCLQHGKLGCHMCLKETSEHSACNIVTATEGLDSLVLQLRRLREEEAAKVVGATVNDTKTSWGAYRSLKASYEAQAAEINQHAADLKKDVDRQKNEALQRLRSEYTDAVGRWQKRITALDELRARGAFVSAVLDAHRALGPSLLLHAETAGLLALNVENVEVPTESIKNLTVNCRPTLPSLFDVNGSNPSISTKKPAGAEVRLGAIRTAQRSLKDLATNWTQPTPAPEGSRTPNNTAAPHPKAAKTAATLADNFVKIAAGKSLKLPSIQIPPPVVAETDDDSAPPQPSAEATYEPMDDSVACVVKGPKDSLLVVDWKRDLVVAVSPDKKGSNDLRPVMVLGGVAEASTFRLCDAGSTVTVPCNQAHSLRRPLCAFHHAASKRIVVCDTGNDRIVMFSDALSGADKLKGSTSTVSGVLRQPSFVAADPATNGLLVLDRQKIHILGVDGNPVKHLSYMKVARTPSNRALPAAATSTNEYPLFAFLQNHTQTVAFASTAGPSANGKAKLVGEYSLPKKRLVVPGPKSAEGPVAPLPAGAVAGTIVALTAHPDLNAVVIVSTTARPWQLELTLVGWDTVTPPPPPRAKAAPTPAPQSAVPAPKGGLPVPKGKQQQQQQQQPPVAAPRGGRGAPAAQQQQQAPPAPKPAAPEHHSVVKSRLLDLGAAVKSENAASMQVELAAFDGPYRVVIGYREVLSATTVEDDGGALRIVGQTQPLRLAVLSF